MDIGEWLTRGTIWLALCLYVASEILKVSRREGQSFHAASWLSTAGCITFLAHVVAAFHFYHHWSHAAAFAETARQTARFSGWNWGGGLYINYAFALLWLSEVIWSCVNPTGYLRRSGWITRMVRGFFLFMICNGAVVFVHNVARWFGLILCLALTGCWWHRVRHRRQDDRV